jgi:hypothetical protein
LVVIIPAYTLTLVLLTGVGTPLPESNQPLPEWTLDLNKMKLPRAPIIGKLFGTDFKLGKAEFQQSGALILSGTTGVVFIFLPTKNGQELAGKSYEFSAARAPEEKRPAVHVHVHQPAHAKAFSDGYALKIEFGKETENQLPGKLYLCLPDEGKSFLAGSFTIVFK